MKYSVPEKTKARGCVFVRRLTRAFDFGTEKTGAWVRLIGVGRGGERFVVRAQEWKLVKDLKKTIIQKRFIYGNMMNKKS